MCDDEHGERDGIVGDLRRNADHVANEDYHYTRPLMLRAADEIDRLQKLLNGRDQFIVNNGLWHEFVANLEK